MNLIPDNFNLSPSGSIDPLFLYADGVRAHEVRAVRPRSGRRLVKASKSPTAENTAATAYAKAQFLHESLKVKHCAPSLEREIVHEHEFRRTKTPHGSTGTKAVIEFRDWAQEWRVRTEVQGITGMNPPDQAGERVSDLLSHRGARKIAESCEYMHAAKGGYKTFVTGTFSTEKREAIARGETTIQKEVSRTMDALQKMYLRGWTKNNGERVSGHDEKLPYLWVVEIPKKDDGTDNPHVHMLLGWQVQYKDFHDWAERIERLWGNGYFHLEKIKNSESAGAYMAKAAGYLCKAAGEDNSQGTVHGNRYGISESARAPDWVKISEKQLHTMGQLIADVYDHLTVQYGEQYAERTRLNKALEATPKSEKKARHKIGERLAKVRAEIKKLPIRCNKYQVILKGKAAAVSFFNWATTETEQGAVREAWLPEKPNGWAWREGESVKPKQSPYFVELRKRMRRLAKVPDWVKNCEAQWKAARDYYNEFTTLERIPAYELTPEF